MAEGTASVCWLSVALPSAHTNLLDDHSVPQRARLLQLLHKLFHVRLEVREGGHLPVKRTGVRQVGASLPSPGLDIDKQKSHHGRLSGEWEQPREAPPCSLCSGRGGRRCGERRVLQNHRDVTSRHLPLTTVPGRMQKEVSWGCWRGRKQVDLESLSWVHPTISLRPNSRRWSLSKKWGAMTEDT